MLLIYNMEHTDNERFSFIWHIENFSMCPQKFEEYLVSPTFVVDFLNETEWRLELYPIGKTELNYVSCYLCRTNGGEYTKSVAIFQKFEVLSIHSGKNITQPAVKATYLKEYKTIKGELAGRAQVFDPENGLLPNDTLTIKCELSKFVEEPEIKTLITISDCKNTKCVNLKPPAKTYGCSARTRVKVTSKSILWPIVDFSALQPNIKLTRLLSSAVERTHPFKLTLYLNPESEADQCICIEIQRENPNGSDVFVRCKIKTVGAPKAIQYQENSANFFNGTEVWTFPTFIKTRDLIENEYFSYTNDVLYLQCDFCFSTKGCEFNIENIDTFSVNYNNREKPCTLRNTLQKLYKDKLFSDITLRVKGRDFSVHKNILGTRSDVFRTMFQSEMQEQKSGVVDIIDFDSHIVERLLCFLYTDILEDLNQEDTLQLYSAADKYNIATLKFRCCSLLIASLSVSNVCKILNLADAHHDQDLLEGVMGFISVNGDEIFHSRIWKDFTENNAQLSASTMIHVLTDKCSV